MGREIGSIVRLVPAKLGKPFLGGVEAGDSRYRWCSDFHPVWIFLWVKFGDRVDSGATCFHVPYIDTLTDDHAADAHGPKQSFVPGKNQHVDSPPIHVNGNHTGCLASVNNKDRRRVLDDPTDGLDVL